MTSSHSIPDDIVIDAYTQFCTGSRKGNPDAPKAMVVLLANVDANEISHEEARTILADNQKISAFITKVANTFQAESPDERILESSSKSQVGLTTILETLLRNTDPHANNKASFWTNVRAGAIYFVAGLVASPLTSIAFKHQLAYLDRKVNPSDYVETSSELTITSSTKNDLTLTVNGTSFTCRVPNMPEPIRAKPTQNALRQGMALHK